MANGGNGDISMNGDEKAALDRRVLSGYAHGPGAPERAIHRALRSIESAHSVILVEGISDQIAVETLARRTGRDLEAEAVVVFPVGGFQAIRRHLDQLGPQGEGLHLAGLCDEDGAESVRRALVHSGVGDPASVEEMTAFGFHVCVRDLEDELIRAVGTAGVEAVIESQGDLGALTTFRKQPVWQGQPPVDQLRRFLGSKARRSLRYARLLIDGVDLDRVPEPIEAVLDSV